MTGALEIEDAALLGPAKDVNGSHPTPWKTILRSVWALLFGILLRRHRPHPFFDENGKTLAQPEVLS
jgi:hypothetical protein